MRQGLPVITRIATSLTALAGFTMLMSGCSGGASTAQSTVEGSYGGVWTSYGAPEAESGAVTFTVDSHGKFVGSFTKDVAGTQVTSFLQGSMQNDGTFTAQVSRSASTGSPVSYSITGHYGTQQIDADYTQSLSNNYSTGATLTAPNATSDTYKPGLSADFRETINGVDYAGTFQAIGGKSTTGS